ncbi:uncharacterized protein A4U43_C07F12080 [Asparagus officinalis]|uniref:gibberellin 2beta-dioxygenase n=1 Tax=Asparagus officinalis TaxID=4686 RepID=A0A5P1EBA4_ASPOF|nr:gibberellin 2-beta-dioxygenase 2-like [Asparagus officinalis]ONK63165.1 uncharacterized protein A4U43_C07F12080 [Asparagus officinalis]
MVMPSTDPAHNDCTRNTDIPVIDLNGSRHRVSESILKACEEFGFFMVTNHGVAENVIARMEATGSEFFSLPASEKQRSGPPNPLGYGFRSIGSNGDTGEVEYLLLHASPTYVSLRAKTICKKDHLGFSCVVTEYVESMRSLACEILELLGEGLKLGDTEIFCKLLRDSKSDSLLRLNHYPASYSSARDDCRIGFGEHTDPQILTLLRSTVGGLQIMKDGGPWVPVKPDPAAFCVHVGDALQAMTNGRLASVRHRAVVNSYTQRMSVVYFGAPPPHASISPLSETVTPENPRRYKSFTWGEYKKAMYSLRLGQNRLDHFLSSNGEEGDCDT